MLKAKLFQAFAALVIVFGALAVLVGVRMIKNRIVGEAQNQVTLELNCAWAIFCSRMDRLHTIVDRSTVKRTLLDAAGEPL